MNTSRAASTNQDRKTTALVVFADILGFEEISKENPNDADDMAREFQRILKHRLRDIPKLGIEPSVHSSTEEMYRTRARIAIISDSAFIVLQSDNPDDWPDIEIIKSVVTGLSLALYDCLSLGIPIRGSIDVGDIYQGPPEEEMIGWHLVGQPVTQVVRGEGSQKWIGISFARNPRPGSNGKRETYSSMKKSDADAYLREALDSLYESKLIHLWPVPTQNGLLRRWALTWPRDDLDDAANSLKCIMKHYSNIDREAIVAKYLSSLVFIEHLQREKHRKTNWSVDHERD